MDSSTEVSQKNANRITEKISDSADRTSENTSISADCTTGMICVNEGGTSGMTRQMLTEYCLTFPGAKADCPFRDGKNTIVRHIGSRRWFAVIFEQEERLCINLKSDPGESEFLRQMFKSVTPA